MPQTKLPKQICLEEYEQLSKSIVTKPINNAVKYSIPLSAAFLCGISAADAQLVYSGVKDVSCGLAANSNRCYADINNAGGNDFEIHRNHAVNNVFIQLDEVPGGGFDINGFFGNKVGAYAYPYALASNVQVGAAGPWAFGAGQGNTLSEANNIYPNDKWTALPNGTTRFIGIRGLVGGATKYGWIRLTKNSFGNFTMVDWAYEASGAPVLTGFTILPIAISTFDIKLENQNCNLNWRTESESNNAGFDIQRSEDGVNFRSIAWVEGHGTSSTPKDYQFVDKNLFNGKTYYYRLRQVDFNNNFKYTQVLKIALSSRSFGVGEFYPNPVTNGKVKLNFNSNENSKWQLIVFDVNGKRIKTATHVANTGSSQLDLDLQGLGKGVYYVSLQSNDQKIYRKLVIQ